jgi:23S rRNA pseudouridine955/2504/2580 synthase
MSQVRFVEVSAEHAGQRLDNFLVREMKGVPKTRLYRALRKGEIRVNKGRVKADYRVQEGDNVRIPPIRMSESQPLSKVPARWQNLMSECCLYQDDGLIVLNKPSGLAVHGGSGLSAGLIECLRLLQTEDRYLELVHRLDRDTSGCLLIAKKSAVLKDLHRQLRTNQVNKTYLALVEGQWSRARSFVDAPLKKNNLQSGERVVRVDKDGKQARTDFKVLERFADCTLVEAKPITGRTHQIRVHAQHAGHPLLGDEKYSPRESLKRDRGRGLSRLFLHAYSLSFQDIEGKRKLVQAELDSDLNKFLESIRK